MNDSNNIAKSSVKISNDIISTIAIKTAYQIEGVYDVWGSSKLKEYQKKSTKIKNKMKMSIKNNNVFIELPIILNNDINSLTVCENIQKAIKENINAITGLTVSEVNLLVENIVIE